MKKILFSLLLVALIGVTTLTVNAAPQTIQLGDSKEIKTGYIAGVTFETKETTKGEYLYCVDMHKKTSKNITANYVKQLDRGVSEIIRNGYPNKSITGDAEKDYYITQTAIWWYLDDTTGSTNLGEVFKSTGSDAYNMRGKVIELVNLGKQYQNAAQPSTVFQISISDNNLYQDGNYFVSKPITISKLNNISSYSVVIENAPEGTVVVNPNGGKIERFTKDTVFVIKVPVSSVKDTFASFNFTAKAVGYLYKAYQYQPTDFNMQNVALLEKETINIPSSITLNINNPHKATSVKINKVDAATKASVAGAVIVIKNEAGQEVKRFTTGAGETNITDLDYGTYTVYEESAPSGYKKSDKVYTVVLNENNLAYQITIENNKEVIVPDTSTTSVVLTILGLLIISSGIGFIYKNGKKA